MTEHLDEGMLQALLDEELSEGAAHASREHVAGCPDCRGRLMEARDANHVLSVALAQLDPARETPAVPLRPRSVEWRRRWGGGDLARAAGLLLTVAAAASATIPGSPVREWLVAAIDSPDPAAEVAVTAAEPEIAATTMAPAETGVSVQMQDGRFEVALTGAAPDLQVRARLVDGERGGVYAVGAAADARFQTAPGSIRVDRIAAGELRVEIPRSATSASVAVDGRPYLVKAGDQLRLVTVDGDSAPAEILFRVRP